MPDLKHLKVEFSNSPVDKDSIPYKDKIREKHRLENLESTQQKRAEIIQSRKSAYLKREKAKKEATRLRNKRNKSQTQDLLAEWNELAEETRLIKKLKRGKNSKDQLDLSSSDDLESAN